VQVEQLNRERILLDEKKKVACENHPTVDIPEVSKPGGHHTASTHTGQGTYGSGQGLTGSHNTGTTGQDLTDSHNTGTTGQGLTGSRGQTGTTQLGNLAGKESPLSAVTGQ